MSHRPASLWGRLSAGPSSLGRGLVSDRVMLCRCRGRPARRGSLPLRVVAPIRVRPQGHRARRRRPRGFRIALHLAVGNLGPRPRDSVLLARNRSFEDALQAIDSIGPGNRVFILFGGWPRAIRHSLTFAARIGAASVSERFRNRTESDGRRSATARCCSFAGNPPHGRASERSRERQRAVCR